VRAASQSIGASARLIAFSEISKSLRGPRRPFAASEDLGKADVLTASRRPETFQMWIVSRD